jgi:hypothetical protein
MLNFSIFGGKSKNYGLTISPTDQEFALVWLPKAGREGEKKE